MPHKILIIDDQPRICSLLEEVFKKDYEVYLATEANKALEIIETAQPDLAIVDMNLGQESGVDLIEKMLEIKNDLLLVMLTGNYTPRHKERGAELGVKAFLEKPFDIIEMRSCIASILSNG
ncbi:response regulator receiver protein [Alkaliphilus metalliredigens QYMF]|uniref:Stage 0 sporulation protein A homolog n=1 Tax=Alkaliphilus metalliredigens (strain QYMF) TaxID=293826 RepID=A6TK28_ALKMQ|nr:response regulator [Alkaliphilus metalliredigens]ABR46546.1 response regulator receiver protein [Alkaliphilus metalliredigens QYMF]